MVGVEGCAVIAAVIAAVMDGSWYPSADSWKLASDLALEELALLHVYRDFTVGATLQTLAFMINDIAVVYEKVIYNTSESWEVLSFTGYSFLIWIICHMVLLSICIIQMALILMLITCLISIMCHSFQDVALLVTLHLPPISVCGGSLVNVLCPDFLLVFLGQISIFWNYLILRLGRDLVPRGNLCTKIPPLKPHGLTLYAYIWKPSYLGLCTITYHLLGMEILLVHKKLCIKATHPTLIATMW